jgi:hypothetical protein
MCEIFNADPIDYADKRELLRGLDFIWFWFGPESRTECETVMKHFESRMPEASLTREFISGKFYRELTKND